MIRSGLPGDLSARERRLVGLRCLDGSLERKIGLVDFGRNHKRVVVAQMKNT